MLTAKVKGVAEAKAKLEKLEKAIRTRAMRKAVSAGDKIATRAMKAIAPKNTGATQKAVGQRIKVYRNNGIVVGIIGVRTKLAFRVQRQGRKRKVVRLKGPITQAGGRVIRPSKIIHLLERGSRKMRARPFVGPTARSTSGQVRATMKAVLAEEIKREVAAL